MGYVCVTKHDACIDVDVASPDVSPAVFAGTADIAEVLSDVAAEQIAVGGSTWTAVIPVNMVNVQTDNSGDDRFSRCQMSRGYGI